MMTNNDVFKKVLHLTGLGVNLPLAIYIFELGGIQATKSKIKGWRTSLDNHRASNMPDHILNAFFDGLFLYRDAKLDEGIPVFQFLKQEA